VVSSYPDPAGGGRLWQRNSAGVARLGPAAPPRAHDAAALLAAGTARPLPHDTGALGPMSFGPRSRNLVSMREDEDGFTAVLSLPDRFAHEPSELPLHPALLDIATAFASLHADAEFRIPLSYRRVLVYGPLTAQVLCRQTRPTRAAAHRQTLTADLDILRPDGTALLRIEGFVLKKAGDLRRRLDGAREGRADQIVPYQMPGEGGGAAVGFLRQQLAVGITPREGADLFERVLDCRLSPGAAICTQDLDAVAEQARRELSAPGRGDGDEPAAAGPAARHPRPPLGTPFAEPDDESARALAALWQDLLGIDAVGLHDDFFELGGHSLLGIQLAARLRRDFGLDVRLDTLFESLTVARLRDLLRTAAPVG
jgi:aryl carrier-like protein